jgi:hypothetical protein
MHEYLHVRAKLNISNKGGVPVPDDKFIINKDTGEIVGTLSEGDTILRGASKKRLTDTVQINKNRPFVKIYTESLSVIAKDGELSGTDYTVLFALMPHIRFETGMVAHDNGHYMRLRTIVQLSKLSERAVYGSIEKLVRKRILAKVRTGRDIKFYVNPYIFMRGRSVNKTLESMFRTSPYNT